MDRRKLASLMTFARGAVSAAKKGNTLNYLRKFKHPTHNINIPRGGSQINIDLPKMQRGKANLSRGVRTSIGNTADSLSILSQGVRGKGVAGGAAQAAKNVGSLFKRQMRGDLYKEVYNPALTRKGGKPFARSKWTFGKDRPVVGKTDRGSHIVRRRKLYDPVSLVAGGSGPSIGALSYALGDKEQSTARRVGDAAIDTALFSVSAPVGIGSALYRGAKASKKEKENKKIN